MKATCFVTVRFARTLFAVLLALSQVVGTTPLQANSCGSATECCCSHTSESHHCCCCHSKPSVTDSCCCHAKANRHNDNGMRRFRHHVCGCGCRRTSQQEAPLSPSSDFYELNPRICLSSLDEIVPSRSLPAFPSARGARDSHTFYAELPQELLFCSWLI